MPSRHDAGWDRIYHRYRPEWLPWELGKPRRVLVELVDSGKVAPGKALDLGCGAGTNPVYLAKKGFDVTALDISDAAIKYATGKAREAEVDISFLIGNFWTLPFRGEVFDFAFDFGCFHHVEVEGRRTFIKGVNRVLKPDATYLMVCFSYRANPLGIPTASRKPPSFLCCSGSGILYVLGGNPSHIHKVCVQKRPWGRKRLGGF